jgi:hypothetical protein
MRLPCEISYIVQCDVLFFDVLTVTEVVPATALPAHANVDAANAARKRFMMKKLP